MAGNDLGFELLAATGFEWDEIKSRANLVKHGIAFDDASEIFYSPVVVKDRSATTRSDGSQSENPTTRS
jgi:uncharacterized protein